MASGVTVRRARAHDAATIAELIGQHVASGALLPRTPEFVAERSGDFLVATIGGRVVGCAHLDEYSPSLAELRSLAVDGAHQGRGVGAALVAAVERVTADAALRDELVRRGLELARGLTLDAQVAAVERFVASG
jgi:amino-acid N-acetyltransferase